jgi:hypothetical protein
MKVFDTTSAQNINGISGKAALWKLRSSLHKQYNWVTGNDFFNLSL